MFLSLDRTLKAPGLMSASSDRTRVRATSHEVSEPDLGAVVEVPRVVLIGELLGLCDGFLRSASGGRVLARAFSLSSRSACR